jgi:hypothetical protein
LRQLDGQVGHVQRAGQRIQQAHCDEEQRRAGQVEDHVVHAAFTLAIGAVQQQAIAGRQQHLEEDEQVEQIGGQEGAVQAHQLELEQRMEMARRAAAVLAGQRVQQRPAATSAVSTSISAESRSSASAMP